MRQAFIALFCFLAALNPCRANESSQPVTLNTPRSFPAISTSAEWQARAKLIRDQILVSAGLWPMPEKPPLHAKIFGKISREGYSVEKVYFQALPGFYVGGNLYRPLGRGKGPFPAVLAPHGHWENGRLVDQKDASYPGLCINFAKQGIIAFSYDMVGYNDTHFADSPTNVPFYKRHRSFETNDPTALLWSVSLMGLQTWDSIRAVDFLVSLPDVDTNRLGCMGASGGGTQTMLLGEIDDRVRALAPVVMVSHTMQGGCLCENMPGLRVEFSNMEIAAAAAPRPQIMVGASGDWTKTMMTVEGPAVAHIYDLFNAPENLRYVRFDFPHNYNQTSREAVYQWFDHVLLNKPDAPVKEVAFQKEPDADLRVFPDGKLPPDAFTQQQVVDYLIKMHRKQLAAMEPRDKKSLENYKELIRPVLERTFHLDYSNPRLSLPHCHDKFFVKKDASHPAYLGTETGMHYLDDTNTLIVLKYLLAETNSPPPSTVVVLVDEKGPAAFTNDSGMAKGLALELLKKHLHVAILEKFPIAPNVDQTSIFFSTYNRTWLQTVVREIAAAPDLAEADDSSPGYIPHVILCGTGRAGLWCLLAAPTVGNGPMGGDATIGVIADCDQLDVSKDKTFLASDLFCPGLRNVDTFNGALILAAPNPLLLYNTGGRFPADELKKTYKILGASKNLRVEKKKLTDEQIADWISKL
ncbi:MAG TPA: acetylxylan esterase [Verrucomicrobiae bacterium]|nr:acetylxylan esterase [Verrucomicrobiae bacterium]